VKLDPDLKLRIYEKVGIYANRFSIIEPKVLLTTREVLDMPREMTEGARTSAYKYLGLSYNKQSLIFINVKKISDERDLENTIVHELIHQRFPYLGHGKRFNKLVRQGLRGKKFLPYQKRKLID
jgi:ATP adenylyltransferase/5',5'''-P-1,P-4-tetraphosphate phosphorylase II